MTSHGKKPERPPVPPIVPVLTIVIVFAVIVGSIAAQFPFDPIGRQIVWIGSSFTLTAACAAYVIQNARRTAWDEARYQAALQRLHAVEQETSPD